MGKLGFGLMRLPLLDEDYTHIDLDRVRKMVDTFMKAGGTYYDTAYVYHGGASEVAFRETVVKRYKRESYTITDKLPMFMIKDVAQMDSIFAEQLERCGVEYFDYYWFHALGKETYELSKKLKAFEFISRKKAQGKIRHIGFSFHDSAEVLETILTEHPEVEYVQLQINYLDWDDKSVQARECYEVAKKHGKPVIVMEPVKGGALANIPEKAGKLLSDREPELSVASWAIRFAATLENVMMVLSGMSNQEQMEDNLSYMKEFKPLSKEEMGEVFQAAQIIKETIAIPCTACKYCIDGCPKKICIPDYFALYNDLECFGKGRLPRLQSEYKELSGEHGKASDCIGCGKCEQHCPQHLEIRTYLEKIAGVME